MITNRQISQVHHWAKFYVFMGLGNYEGKGRWRDTTKQNS